MTDSDDIFEPADPQDDDTAAWLDRHFGLPASGDAQITAGERAAIRARVLGSPASAPSPSSRATGIVAGAPMAFPESSRGSIHRVPGLAAAAVLVLMLAATLATYLRSDDGERLPGAAATASVLPFAPGSALASPVAATCATDATLLLMPAPGAGAGALADLPFPVAWYRDGTLTVQHGDEVLREIEIGKVGYLRATAVPGVIVASTWVPGDGYSRYAFVNIDSGRVLELGAVRELTALSGPYVFWTVDGSYTRWSVTDLRDFQTVDLGERFQPEPLMPWRPYAGSLTTSADGAVVLAGTTSGHPVNETLTPATPFPADLPPLDVSRNAILIDGSLDDIRLVGPLAATSGAMALSPAGATVAWLAPFDRAGQRKLVIENVATGETIRETTIEATYSNSLLFSADGATLYATHGTTLAAIPVHPDAATPAPATRSIALPDTAYRILGASPDRAKLLLARTTSASPETSLWVDTTTGEIRELPGTPGRMFTGQVPGVAGMVNRYVLLDDIGSAPGDREIRIVDMATGEVVVTEQGRDTGIVTISADGSTLLIPRDDGIALIDLATGRTTDFPAPMTDERTPAPEGVEGVSWTFALSPDGGCAAGNWDLEGDEIDTVLLPAAGGEPVALPDSGVGGWVATDGE